MLGNKIDIPGAASEDEVRHVFGLHGQTTGKVSPTRITFVFMYTYFLLHEPAYCKQD